MTKPEEFVVPGAAKTAGARATVRERVVEAQLEKSWISSFRIIPYRGPSVEPQDRLIAACVIDVQLNFD